MGAERSRAGRFRGIYVCVVAAAAALALAVAPASASAASPLLEFASPGNSFPIPFEAEGGGVSARLGDFDKIVDCTGSEGAGEITGPRTTLSAYAFYGCVAEDLGGGGLVKCTTEDADEEEIWSEEIEADLVYLDQAKHEAAMLLNPDGGVYMEFECGTNDIVASGPFLAPVTPVNVLASSFTAELNRNENAQIPTQYEDLNGVKHQAIPTAVVNGGAPDMSGVELSFAITPSVPLQISAVSAAEIEAKEQEEAARKRQEEEAAAKKRAEEEAAKAAAEKKRAEEAAAAAAAKKLQEEQQAQAELRKRKQLRAKGLRRCRANARSKRGRVRCENRVKRKYGRPAAKSRANIA